MKNSLKFHLYNLLCFILYISLSILLFSCQDIFTAGFFELMQADPEDMSRDDLIRYGWDVIATGDKEKMLDAYNVVKEMLITRPNDGELAYLGANLAIELSGIADFIINPPRDNFNEYKAGLDSAYIMEAGPYFQIAESHECELNAADSINCGISLLLTTAGGDFDVMETIDIDNPGLSEEDGAAYIDAGTDILGSDYRVHIILVFFTVV